MFRGHSQTTWTVRVGIKILKRLKISFFLQYILTVTHDSAQNVNVYDCTQFLKKQVNEKTRSKNKCIIVEIIKFCFKILLRHQYFFLRLSYYYFWATYIKEHFWNSICDNFMIFFSPETRRRKLLFARANCTWANRRNNFCLLCYR